MRGFISLVIGATLTLLPALVRAEDGGHPAPLPGDGRLAYVQKMAQGCAAGLWDSKDRSRHDLATLSECPHAAALTSHGKVLVLFDKADIRLLDLGSGKPGDPVPLPSDAPGKNLDTEALLAGDTPDGVLALQLSAVNPDSSSERTLYLFKDGAWVAAERQHCGSFATDCPFKQKFESRLLDDVWATGPTEIWNDALRGDPYVVKRIPATITPQTAGYDGGPLHNSLIFKVDGKATQLLFDTQVGDDTDGILTFRLSLVQSDGTALPITDDQFSATIVGRYLLFYGFFGAGTRLYDLGDGKVVLDGLNVAGWLY